MIKQKIKKLRTEGLSLREISKKLNSPYSTVRRHCKNIEMSEQGKKRYHSKVKGVVKYIKIKEGLNEEKVRIISNLLFDGAVYKVKSHYSVMYVNSSKELIDQFMGDMWRVYGVKPSSFEIFKTYYRVKYLSKQIYNDLMDYFDSFSTSDPRCSIPSLILDDARFKIIILRAFWENEGSISKEGKLSADLINFKVIKQLSNLHNEFGLKHNISKYWKNKWAYKLFLSRSKENYQRFLDLNLLSKANVTRGHFIGRKKIDVLKEYFNNKFVP